MDVEPGLYVKASNTDLHTGLSLRERARLHDADMGWRTSVLRLGLHARLNSADTKVCDQALEVGYCTNSVHGWLDLERLETGNTCTYYRTRHYIQG